MATERWAQIKQILSEALDRAPPERQRLIDQACAGEPELQREIERYLALEARSQRLQSRAECALTDVLALPSNSPSPGDQVGSYRLVRVIGIGGMGTVWEAMQERPQRKVAIKTLRWSQAHARDLQRFLFEAEVLGSLTHEHIARIYEAGTFADESGADRRELPFIAMEYVEDARTLIEHARAANLASRSRLELFLQLCDGVHHAHQRGVIHRDLKPSNVLVSRDGHVKIIDFGIARAHALEAGSSLEQTRTGQILGTLQYMSPEQIEGRSSEVDAQSDVYALGLILFELLTFARPYELADKSIPGIVSSMLDGVPRRMSEIAPELAGELEWIVSRAIDRDRARRYLSVFELGAEIQRYLAFEPVLAGPPSTTYRLRKFVRRHAFAVASAGAVLCVLIAGIIGTAIGFVRAVGAERRATENARAAERSALDASARGTLAELEKAKVLRLSDAKRLEELESRARDLWPARPETIAAYEQWLRDARALAERLPEHRQTLEIMRSHALPWADEERRRDHDSHPRHTDLVDAELHRKRHELGVTKEKLTASEEAEHVERLNREIADLEQELSVRRTFAFAGAEDRWQHDTLSSFVEALVAFADPERGRVRDVEERFAFARTIQHRSLDGPSAASAWREAIDSIRDRSIRAAYGGLEIRPQIGLLPIGRDPSSGLFEFVHLETGDAPLRGDDGRLTPSEDAGLVFVLVPGGTFRMGAQKIDRSAPNYDPLAMTAREAPVHEVTLAPFFISKYEMTQAQWLRVDGTNPSNFGPGVALGGKAQTLLDPVEFVSWDECLEMMRRLALQLPTEAQWEYAARAGTSTPWWTGADPASLAESANLLDLYAKQHGGPPGWPFEEWLDDGATAHSQIGSYLANAFGLHDVHGNVWEWCRDWFDYYGRPVAPGDGDRQSLHRETPVFRGGCYDEPASGARIALRAVNGRSYRAPNLGLRPARALEP